MGLPSSALPAVQQTGEHIVTWGGPTPGSFVAIAFLVGAALLGAVLHAFQATRKRGVYLFAAAAVAVMAIPAYFAVNHDYSPGESRIPVYTATGTVSEVVEDADDRDATELALKESREKFYTFGKISPKVGDHVEMECSYNEHKAYYSCEVQSLADDTGRELHSGATPKKAS